jgi:hypothetical protein
MCAAIIMVPLNTRAGFRKRILALEDVFLEHIDKQQTG